MAERAYTLDTAHIERRIMQAAMRGGQAAAEYALERIRAHAPVRHVFRGTTFHEDTGQPITRRVSARSSVPGEAGISARGHANSSEPLFRSPTGRTFITGDFRRIDPGTGDLARVRADLFTKNRGGGFQHKVLRGFLDKNEVEQPGRSISARQLKDERGLSVVTARGGFEIRSGRANFRAPFDASVGGAKDETPQATLRRRLEHRKTAVTRVGGRLKGELHIEGPIRAGDMIWWYVVSATKDPKTGRLYPRDQEFGTSHNRPHPFMRPGLHESKGPFRRFVRESIRAGTR